MPVFSNLEFHRTGIGLVPERPGEKHTAIYVALVPGSGPRRSCTCAVSKKKTCDHLQDLSKAVAALLERLALFQATEQERMFFKAGMKTP